MPKKCVYWIDKPTDRQLLASHEPARARAPYATSDYYVPPMPAMLPFSAAERFTSAPSSSLSSAAFSTVPTSSSRLTLSSSLQNPDMGAAPTRTLYSPAMEPQPAAWQFHEMVKRNASSSSSHSASLQAQTEPSRERQRSKPRESFLVTQQFASRHHCKWSSILLAFRIPANACDT